MDPLQSRSNSVPLSQGSIASIEDIDDIFDDVLGEIGFNEKETEQTVSTSSSSLPQPEANSISLQKEMEDALRNVVDSQKDSIMHILSSKTALFKNSPDQLRNEIKQEKAFLCNMRNVQESSAIPLRISLLTGKEEDQRVAMVADEFFEAMGIGIDSIPFGQVSEEQVNSGIQKGFLSVMTEDQIKKQEEAFSQQPLSLSQLEKKELEDIFSGIDKKHHNTLSQKPDILVELEMAKISFLSQNESLVPVYVNMEINMVLQMLSGGSSNDVQQTSLTKDQRERMGQAMTQYLVSHYHLEDS